MTQPVVVVGAGGFGRDALDVIDAMNQAQRTPAFAVLGIVDDAPSGTALTRLAGRQVEWLGGIEEWLESEGDAQYVIGIGNPSVRRAIDRRFAAAERVAATLMHPSATVGSMGSIGAGSVVCSGVQISTNVTLGRHVHVNPNATIGHDAVLGDYVSVNPGAIVSGDVTIEPGALIGAGAVILQGLTVGGLSTVGASACVVRNVAAEVTVRGVPAR